MTLTQEQFDNLVKQLEVYAYRQPEDFRKRVFLLVIMGYGYILIVLSFLLWVIVTICSANYRSLWMGSALVIALILLGIVVRSLWVQIPKPKGKRLRRKEVPCLFKLVDELSIILKTPKFHNILLTNELNAAVLQRPRLGIFGWFENYLLVGLPLMQALTLEQFHAIIAHEFGHLSAKHSRFAGWIYRTRQAWVKLLQGLHKHYENSKSGSGIWYIDLLMLVANGLGFLVFGWFFKWFVSKFTAYSFVLASTNEYEADKCSANLVGGEHFAQGLISIAVKHRYINRTFWREIYQQADRNSKPPDAIPLMFQALQTEIPSDKKERWLKAALTEKTDTSDTHPCLSERLSALGYLANAFKLSQKLVITKSAAKELFSEDFLKKITMQTNEEWLQTNMGFWQVRNSYLQDITPKLLELEEKAKTRKLTFDEKWNICRWTKEIKGGDAAIPLLQNLLIEKSYYAPANHLLGKILLEKQDATGIRYIDSAVSCNVELTVSAYQLVCDFLYYEQGNTERIRYYQNKIEQYYYRQYFRSLD
ncbi:M48 family metallopeptidase [Mastigocoleus testarum]|uniref:Peptidase M48 domain-containing protein n=1 Tax=Mastigocoleus testarum BC008 TaxID=371196 RepID=A0A0V7ZG25_9CYAN|nr:M48 family metallopeptidase [Mastigocoleus testarum]KST63540.1 hypothetical protein BC008_13835 [Mastigocoleus testarum BC008]